MNHPTNKFQRKIEAEKHSVDKSKKARRAGKVRRKLLTESLKEKETEDELKEFRKEGGIIAQQL